MPNNLLITGPPGAGKSTVLSSLADRLAGQGATVAGLIAPEMRTLGARVGFRLEDLATGEGKVMAHIDRRQGPRVGKYRVDVEAVDQVSQAALSEAAEGADVVLIDEIAPMEVHSQVFCELVEDWLEAEVPVAGVVHRTATEGFIGQVKAREDVEVIEVSSDNRDRLPDELIERLAAEIGT